MYDMEYNSTRNHLIMREYGRNIQKMIEYLLSLTNEEDKQRNIMAVIELMGTLNPHLRNVEDFRHKLWDHLFLISDFRLKADSPYPIPTRESLKARPDRLPYPKKHPRFRHLGKNLELVMNKAIAETDPGKKEGFTQVIGNYMKLAYGNWHKESVHDDMIRNELAAITDNQLNFQTQNTPFYNIPDSPYRLAKRRSYPHKNLNIKHSSPKAGVFKYNRFNKNRNK